MVLIPFLSSFFYMAGGKWNKWYRWGLGMPIAIIGVLMGHYGSIMAIPAYFIATNIFSYGENMWTTKLFRKWVSMAISGLAFGLASYSMLPPYLAMIQTIIATISFVVIKWFDDRGKLVNPYTELLRGLLGSIVYVGV